MGMGCLGLKVLGRRMPGVQAKQLHSFRLMARGP